MSLVHLEDTEDNLEVKIEGSTKDVLEMLSVAISDIAEDDANYIDFICDTLKAVAKHSNFIVEK